MPRYQTLGNDNKDAMLDFHQSEDKRNFYIYVTSIVIIKLTFVMFLLKQSTLPAVIFPFVPLVLSLLCVYYIRILLSRNVCLAPNGVVSNECDDVLDNVAPCIEQKCGKSALCIQQNDVAKEIKLQKNSGLVMRCLLIVVILTMVITMCEDDSIVSPAEYL